MCQLFKGLFFYCDGPRVDSQNITEKADCLQYPENKWSNQKYNFDNIFNALMALFVLSSKDGWVDIMYHGLDAVGVDKQVTKSNVKIRLYFKKLYYTITYMSSYFVCSQDRITMNGDFSTSFHFSSLLDFLSSTCLSESWWRTSTGVGLS